jgi:transglutaminase-like putative cysteine protease
MPKRHRFLLAAAVLLATWTAVRGAHASDYLSVQPPPSWIAAPLELPPAGHGGDAARGGIEELVRDWQYDVSRGAYYGRTVYRVTDPSGLGDAAELSFAFDPAYQKLIFHHIRLVRDGRTYNRLDLADFDVLREERDRERAIYNGRLTAVMQLRDVRVGDIIDYAYTRRGRNPVFGGRFATFLRFGWSQPLGRLRYRIVAPVSRPLQFQNLGPPVGPADHSVRGALQEWRWDMQAVPAIVADKETPAWYDNYPYIQVSEFATWRELVEWALPLYALPETLPPELQAQLDSVTAKASSDEEKALAVLTFVQDEIRYLGIELGTGSHHPRPPHLTLENRFGDCKDKSFLLCIMLRALGFEAFPVLVSTDYGPELDHYLPAPTDFDHVITCLEMADGRRLWLDPTVSHQGGSLAAHAAQDFGMALVLRPETTGLTRMTLPAEAMPQVEERTVFTSQGYDQPARLAITTTYRGQRANGTRSWLQGRSRSEITRDYLNFYARHYPGIRAAGDLQSHDDRRTNILVIEEHYSVPNFWEADEKGGWRCDLYPYLLQAVAAAPEAAVRRAPLAVDYPENYDVAIIVNLHTDWQVEAFADRIEDAAFLYTGALKPETPRRFALNYHFESRMDHVPAEQAEAYAAKLAEVRANMGYTLTRRTEAAGAAWRLNPWTTAAMLLILGAGAAVALRYQRRPSPPAATTPAYSAIGGWLCLPALSLCVLPLIIIGQFVKGHGAYFNGVSWQALLDRDAGAVAALLVVEVAMNALLLAVNGIAALLFFKRRREAPRWMILLLSLGVVLPSLEALLGQALDSTPLSGGELRQMIRGLISCAIWIPYFLKSRRVRGTFVH